MPLARIRKLVLQNVHTYDTRALELYIAGETILWGFLTLALHEGLVRIPSAGIHRPTLAAMFILAGAFQMFAVRNQYPRWCAIAAFFSAAVWTGTSWAMLSTGALQAYSILALFNAFAGLQILFYRQASL